MTKKELLEALKDIGDDALVVLARDGEGNGFSPLDEVGEYRYLPETKWSGVLVDEDPAGPDVVTALVLWPVN